MKLRRAQQFLPGLAGQQIGVPVSVIECLARGGGFGGLAQPQGDHAGRGAEVVEFPTPASGVRVKNRSRTSCQTVSNPLTLVRTRTMALSGGSPAAGGSSRISRSPEATTPT